MRFLSPNLLFGPIFQKEVRTSGRRRGTYLFRALYTLGLLLLVGVAFDGMRNSASVMSGVQRLQQLQELAPNLALVVAWFQFIALTLAAPIFTGPAICDEKRARTLSALLTTPLSAAQIIYGKLASRVVQLIILALMAAPILLAIRVFGGLDAGVIIAATSIAITTAILGAALGLMYSAWHKRGSSAAIFAILSLVLIQAAPSVVEGIIYYTVNDLTNSNRDYEFHENILVTCSPATLAMISERVAMGGELPTLTLHSPWLGALPGAASEIDKAGTPTRALDLGPTWVVNSLYNLSLTLLITLFTTARLRRIMLRDAAGEGAAVKRPRSRRAATPIVLPARPDSTVPAAPEAPADSQPETEAHDQARDRDSRTVSDHPVFWREVRQITFGSRRRFLIAALIAGAALLFLYAQFGFEDEGLHLSFAVLGGIVVMLQPVFMTTGSIAGEREARTWEVLLTTPIRGRSILLGKTAGALRAQWFLPALILLHFLISVLVGRLHWIVLPHLFLILLGPTLLFTATGQLFSLIFRKSTTAAVCNLLLALLLWLGSWITLGLVGWAFDPPSDWIDPVFRINFQLNPVAMACTATDGALRPAYGLARAQYAIEGAGMEALRLSALGFLAHTAVVCAAYAAAALYAFSLAAMLFPRLGGRAWSPRQNPEPGLALFARIATAVLLASLAGGLGFATFRIPGAVAGLTVALGFLAWWAARRRAAADETPPTPQPERPQPEKSS